MRTKTLIVTAVLALAGIVSASAQVYSVNAVGYVNKSIPKGFSMVANPLVASSNTVKDLFAAAPDGTTIYKFNGAAYTINGKDFGEWANPSETLMPGEGAFVSAPSAFTVTFVGEVMQGALTNDIPKGFSIRSSQVPQSGDLSAALGFPAKDGDSIYRFNNTTGAYMISTFDFGAWDSAPIPEVAESFFVSKVAAEPWVRNFSVNQ
jgi:hypothetical protein